jgi:hypothetical protein
MLKKAPPICNFGEMRAEHTRRRAHALSAHKPHTDGGHARTTGASNCGMPSRRPQASGGPYSLGLLPPQPVGLRGCCRRRLVPALSPAAAAAARRAPSAPMEGVPPLPFPVL